MIQIYPDEKSGNLKKVSAFFIIQHGMASIFRVGSKNRAQLMAVE